MNGRIAMSLVIVLLIGMSTATLVGTGFGVVALLPEKYTTALMAGQGIAGVFIGGLKLLFDFVIWPGKLQPMENENQGLIYFSIAGAVMLLCVLCTFLLEQSTFYQYYQRRVLNSTMDGSTDSLLQQTVDDESDIQVHTEPTRWGVLKQIWPDALNVFMVFFVTLSLFPGFTVMMPSWSTNPNFNKAFVTLLITIFQLGDAIGRMMPALVAPAALKNTMFMFVWGRLAFYPLFIFSICQVQIFKDDWIPILVMAVFSLSNGYFGSLAMMWGPGRVTDSREQGIAGTMMSFFLQFGIWTAVHFAFLLKYVVTGSVLGGSNCTTVNTTSFEYL
jgi:equilibrative nucleoside transporter 1/2/3